MADQVDEQHDRTPDTAPRWRRIEVHCPTCRDLGHVCENHPDRPWGGLCCVAGSEGGTVCGHGACGCGAGAPCPACCPPTPKDGSSSITDAFTPM